MKILLINPPIREWSKPNVFPLGLGYIASTLIRDGHDVEVLDINALRLNKAEVEERIRSASFDVVGIGGIVTVYRYVKWISRVIKTYHPHCPIMIGGSVGSSIPHLMLKNNPVDVVCVGEGEITAGQIVKALETQADMSRVHGIWYKDKCGNIHSTQKREPITNLDEIPYPSWELFPIDIYLKNPVGAPNCKKWVDGGVQEDRAELTMNLYATRGCPYRCIYCYHDFMGHGHRHRSPEDVVNEIRILHDKYNVSYFHFIDDEFVMKGDFVYEFCKRIKALSDTIEFRITWGCTARVNLVTEDMIATMADAGCVQLGYGIETGSQKMLDFIRKGVSVEQAKSAIRLTRKHLGSAGASFMIGYPGESKETIQETIMFCKEAELTPEVIFFLTPYPGTELYDMAMRQGKIGNEEEYILSLGEQGEKIRINFTDMSDKELYDIQANMIDELNAANKIKHLENH